MLKKLFTTKLVIIPISILVVLILLIGGLIFFNKYMTPLEKIKVNEEATRVVYNIDEVIEKEYAEDSYVMFALDYLKQEKNENTFTIYEVRDLINEFFDVNYDLDKLNSIAITPYMVERGVTFNTSTMSYTYNKTYTRTDISEMRIVKYNLKKISKKSKNSYVVTYDKYVVTKPYNIYNYYISNDNSQEKVDAISSYLKGEGPVNKVKDLINDKNIDQIGTKEGQLKITYKLIDNKLKVSKVDKK